MAEQASDFRLGRREFGKMALGGAAFMDAGGAGAAEIPASAAGIRICAQSSGAPTADELLFLKQLGVRFVSVTPPANMRNAEGFIEIKKRYAAGGITVWNIANLGVHNMPEVTLNLPGRDQKIEEYKNYLRNLGKAGIK